jgi:hypothetical protein
VEERLSTRPHRLRLYTMTRRERARACAPVTGPRYALRGLFDTEASIEKKYDADEAVWDLAISYDPSRRK